MLLKNKDSSREINTEIEGADDNEVEVSAQVAVTTIDHYTTSVNCNSKLKTQFLPILTQTLT